MFVKYYSLISFVVLFFCILNVNSQIESIELTKGDEVIKINSFTPVFSIYVDKNKKVYLEKEEINLYKITKTLAYNRSKLPLESRARVKIFLYIDKSVNYSIVDEIKTQLASAHFINIVYKTNSIEDKDILNGIAWRNHQSFFHLADLKKVTTKKQKEKNNRINDSIYKVGKAKGSLMSPPPMPPPNHWSVELSNRIYYDQQDVIDEILESKKYSCITLNSEGIKVNNKLFKYDDIKALDSLFYSNNVIMLRFGKELNFAQYLKVIKYYKELKRQKLAIFLELSSEIENIHKKAKIKLCN